MNRLQKKCLIVSALVHLLLLGILVFGPAFVPARQPRLEVFEVIEFTPLRTTDLPVTGGGSPTGMQLQSLPEPKHVTQPERVQPKPEVKQQPEPVVQPTQTKSQITKPQITKPQTSESKAETAPAESARPTDASMTTAKPTRRLPEVSTQLVSRAQVFRDNAQPRSARGTATGLQPDHFAATVNNLRQQLSSGGSTMVELLGPGGGGIPYANFKQAVFSAYYNAWTPPATITTQKIVTKATVTIARDGTVISARITEPSGDPVMDESVQRALERVKFVAPLPAETAQPQRTLTIIFDLSAKRGIG